MSGSKHRLKKLDPETRQTVVEMANFLKQDFEDLCKVVEDMKTLVDGLDKLETVRTRNIITGSIEMSNRIKAFRSSVRDLRSLFMTSDKPQKNKRTGSGVDFSSIDFTF